MGFVLYITVRASCVLGLARQLLTNTSISASAGQIQTSSAVVADTKQFLSSCPTDVYVVATQPGLNTADFATGDSQAMPSLHLAATKDARVKGRYIVSEVLGQLPDYDMAAFVKAACEKRGKSVKVMEAKLPELSEGARRASLQDNGRFILQYASGKYKITNPTQTRLSAIISLSLRRNRASRSCYCLPLANLSMSLISIIWSRLTQDGLSIERRMYRHQVMSRMPRCSRRINSSHLVSICLRSASFSLI